MVPVCVSIETYLDQHCRFNVKSFHKPDVVFISLNLYYALQPPRHTPNCTQNCVHGDAVNRVNIIHNIVGNRSGS
jgi:hypothetical protein